jgi:hypothetical protein
MQRGRLCLPLAKEACTTRTPCASPYPLNLSLIFPFLYFIVWFSMPFYLLFTHALLGTLFYLFPPPSSSLENIVLLDFSVTLFFRKAFNQEDIQHGIGYRCRNLVASVILVTLIACSILNQKLCHTLMVILNR